MTAAPRAGAARVVRCPSCGRPASFEAANRWRPFCSERCRGADLGAWASEGYRLPERPAGDADDDGSPFPAADRPD